MQDIIEPIIHKAAVQDLTLRLRTTGLSIGDTAELRMDADNRIAVFAPVIRRRFFIRRAVLRHVGYLGPSATALLAPMLGRNDHLRVRIVGLTPEHLATDGKAEMYVSVWGATRHLSQSKTIRTATSPSASAVKLGI
jgi:hypothetical protein